MHAFVGTYPRLRAGVLAGRSDNGYVHLVFAGTGRHCIYEADQASIEVIARLGNGAIKSYTDLLSQVNHAAPACTEEQVVRVLAILQDEDALDLDPPPSPTDALEERPVFEKQVSYFRDVTSSLSKAEQAQQRLRDATVAIVGIGGIGTWVTQGLAMIGVGRLRVFDGDVVDVGNLARQVLYGAGDTGRPKATVAKTAIEELTGGRTVIEAHPTFLGPESPKDMFDGCDLVMNCADEPDVDTVMAWVSARCFPYRIPHIGGGGYSGHAGHIGMTIQPYKTACYECRRMTIEETHGLGQLDYFAGDRRRTGAFAPLASSVASFHVWDAVRLITGVEPPLLSNRTGELDSAAMDVHWSTFDRRPDCGQCGATAKESAE